MKVQINRAILSILLVLTLVKSFSQDRQYGIPFMVVMQEAGEDGGISNYFKTTLLNKINQEITKDGCGATELTRFAVIVTPEVLNKINNGQLLMYQFTLSFSFQDLITKKTYSNFTVELAGIGKTPGQTVYDASKRFNLTNSEFGVALKKATSQIVDYYKRNCYSIVEQAKTSASTGQVDEAISELYSIPNLQEMPCTSKVNETLITIYSQSASSRCNSAINEARKEWNLSPNEDGAKLVSKLLSNIAITQDCSQGYYTLLSEIKARLDTNQFQSLRFRDKVYDNSIDLEKQRLSNIKDIAIEYFKNKMPPTYINNYYNDNKQLQPSIKPINQF